MSYGWTRRWVAGRKGVRECVRPGLLRMEILEVWGTPHVGARGGVEANFLGKNSVVFGRPACIDALIQ